MRKFLAIFLVIFLPVFYTQTVYAQTGAHTPPLVYSDAAIVMDAETGQVLYNKNMNTPMYPASLTKILTCLIAMEDGDFSDMVTITPEMVDLVPDATNISLTEEEIINFGVLTYAMMVESANDAANAIALHMGGSFEDFSEIMNERAKKAGALNSNFLNPSGLPEDEHITTAYDLAMITKAAMEHPQFRTLAGTQKYTIPPTNKESQERVVHNLQYMFTGDDTYPGAFAGKTGWTEESGHTLMTLAERDGRTLICIVMKAHGIYDAQFIDSTTLLDYGFDQFSQVLIPHDLVSAQLTSYIDLQAETVERAHVQKMQPFYLPLGMSLDDIDITIEPKTLGPTTRSVKLLLTAKGTPDWIPAQIGEIPVSLQMPIPASAEPAQTTSLLAILRENPYYSAAEPYLFKILGPLLLLFIIWRIIVDARYKRQLKKDRERLAARRASRQNFGNLDVRYTKPKRRMSNR